MNILPIYAYQAEKKHWVVRFLRNAGYFICFLSSVGGLFLSLSLFGPPLSDRGAAVISVIFAVLGALIGFLVGLLIGLPFWGLAMLLDDVHALRIYASGYFADDDGEEEDPAPAPVKRTKADPNANFGGD